LKEQKYIIPLFVPDEGCPFRCIYCNQKEITGKDNLSTGEEIKRYIDEHLSFFRDKDRKVMLCFYGGSFTGIGENKQTLYLETVHGYIKNGQITEIGLSTRPDYIDDEKIKTLQRYNVTTIEIGAQSMSDEILGNSCRGHDSDSVVNAVRTIHRHGLRCGIQLLPGLPGETDQTIAQTTERVIDLMPEFTRIYPLLVLKNTKLADMYLRGEYEPLTLEKAVGYSVYMLRRFAANGIDVVRIGLHSGTGIEKALVAGPYHNAFGELVLSRYILENVIAETVKYDKIYNIEIFVGKGMMSAAKGHKKENVRAIEIFTGTKDIAFTETGNGRFFTDVKVNKGETEIVSEKS
jgi:histone acetyltransferase (RNA polymerase elongator complex component)